MESRVSSVWGNCQESTLVLCTSTSDDASSDLANRQPKHYNGLLLSFQRIEIELSVEWSLFFIIQMQLRLSMKLLFILKL